MASIKKNSRKSSLIIGEEPPVGEVASEETPKGESIENIVAAAWEKQQQEMAEMVWSSQLDCN